MSQVQHIKDALPLAIALGLVLAILYLAGFWFPLRINPFHYTTASDLATATLATLAIVMILLAAAMMMGAWSGSSSDNRMMPLTIEDLREP